MKICSSISEDGEVILLDIIDGSEEFCLDLEVHEARKLMLLIRDSLIKADVLKEFHGNRFRNEN